MNPSEIADLRRRYLQSVYEHTNGDIYEGVNEDKLLADLGISIAEGNKLFSYLNAKGLVRAFTFGHLGITDRGIDEVERIMAESYAAKEFRVLKTIHETKHKASNGWVNLDDLIRELSDIPRRELFMILADLENRKGLIGSIDQAVWMVPAGIEELEQAERYPDRSTQYFPAQIINYTVNVQGDNRANIQQGGRGNTQTNIVVGSDFEQAIRQLLAGIEQSQSLTPLQKIRAKGDIQAVNNLARVEKTPEIVAEADTRITAIQAVLSTTADLVSLGMVVIPILRAAFGG